MRRGRYLLSGGVAVLAALALTVFSGCTGGDTDGYESTSIYPPRLDPLVLDLSKALPPTSEPPPGKWPEFVAGLTSRNGVLKLPSQLTGEQQQALSMALVELFGSPADPKIDHATAVPLGLTSDRLAAGSRVYKRHCVQCHGMTGDGRGPTSLWVFPPARDFRQATFKYVTTTSGFGWPTRADILRTLRRGIGGASMPSFALLSEQDQEDVTSYTLLLMLRGKVEFDTIRGILTQDDDSDIRTSTRRRLSLTMDDWNRAATTVNQPPPLTPLDDPRMNDEAIRRGNTLFKGEKAACATCHIDYGRKAVWRYDVWGVPVKPSNLVDGHPRGGIDAIDFYHRLKCGVVGAGMPPANQLNEVEIRDLVLLLRALPDPQQLPGNVRSEVYPNLK